MLASAYAGWMGSLPEDEITRRLELTIAQTYERPDQWVRGWTSGLVTAAAPPHVVEHVKSMVSAFHPVGARAMTRAVAEADLRAVLPRVEVPTLLIYGDNDVRSPVHVAEALHAQIPGSALVVIQGPGHACNAEAPDRFNAEVRAFLQSVP